MDDLAPDRIREVDRSGLLGDVMALPDHLRDALWRVESSAIAPFEASVALQEGFAQARHRGVLQLIPALGHHVQQAQPQLGGVFVWCGAPHRRFAGRHAAQQLVQPQRRFLGIGVAAGQKLQQKHRLTAGGGINKRAICHQAQPLEVMAEKWPQHHQPGVTDGDGRAAAGGVGFGIAARRGLRCWPADRVRCWFGWQAVRHCQLPQRLHLPTRHPGSTAGLSAQARQQRRLPVQGAQAGVTAQ